jgi:hypothetical protein
LHGHGNNFIIESNVLYRQRGHEKKRRILAGTDSMAWSIRGSGVRGDIYVGQRSQMSLDIYMGRPLEG